LRACSRSSAGTRDKKIVRKKFRGDNTPLELLLAREKREEEINEQVPPGGVFEEIKNVRKHGEHLFFSKNVFRPGGQGSGSIKVAPEIKRKGDIATKGSALDKQTRRYDETQIETIAPARKTDGVKAAIKQRVQEVSSSMYISIKTENHLRRQESMSRG